MHDTLTLAERHGRRIEEFHISQSDTNDCGPHVVAMLVNFWHGRQVVVAAEVARAMNRPRISAGWLPLIVRRIPNWATFPWGIVDVLRAHDVPARWSLRAREDDIQRALRENRPVMPIFGEPLRREGWHFTGWAHVAIICGWEPGAYLFVDSSHESAPSRRDYDVFMHCWNSMGRLLIETTG